MKSPNIEGLKEVARWALLFAVSWVVTEMLKQINLVPEAYTLKVSVFTFLIPIRLTVQFLLTFLGRYADKYLFVKTSQEKGETKGLLPF